MKKKHKMTRHHRKPRCRGGGGLKNNISKVPENLHQAYHLLFGEGHPEKVAAILNNTWIDTDYILIPVPKDFAEGIKNRLERYLGKDID